MSTVPPPEPAATQPAAPALSGQLSLGEAAVFVTAIVAVTVLAVLKRPVPGVLTALASAACLLLLPGRAGRLLAALTSGSRG